MGSKLFMGGRDAGGRLLSFKFGQTLAKTALCALLATGFSTLSKAQEVDQAFQKGLENAYKSSRLLEGLDLSTLERKGQSHLLNLPSGKGVLRFFVLQPENENRSQTTAASAEQIPSAESESPGGVPEQLVSSEEKPDATATPAPVGAVTRQELSEPAPVPTPPEADAESSPQQTANQESPVTPQPAPSNFIEPMKGSFHFSYETERLSLETLAGGLKLGTQANLLLEDVVIVFNSEAKKIRLKKLPVSNKADKNLRKVITNKRREIDLKTGGLIFAKLNVKKNPFLQSLDKALSIKNEELLVQGTLNEKMMRRILKLAPNSSQKAPGIQEGDLKLDVNLGGFRPQKIGRYVDASEAQFGLQGSETGTPVYEGTVAARFGIGARKVKVPAKILIDPSAPEGKNTFEMRATAGKKDLRNVKVSGNPLQELDFLFALNNTFEPRLRAEGHALKQAQKIPVAGELDDEDGKDLFKLDGSTLEALAGLDIPGLDEIKLPEIPPLNTGRAVTADTIIRGQPAKIVIGPIANDRASYIALSIDGGGIENLIPVASLGPLGNGEAGRSIFVYVPKGRAPPKLSEFPGEFRSLYLAYFDELDLAKAKTGLNLFQASEYSNSHVFSKGLSVLRGGKETPTSVKLTGSVNPLIFDEPEDNVAKTWNSSDAKARLRSIISTVDLRGQVSGLEGIGLGTLFRITDRAEFDFQGTKSGKLQAGLSFAGAFKPRGAAQPRLFDIDARLGETGTFRWRGDEIDGDGEALKSGLQIELTGQIKNKRPENMNLAMSGKFRLGDLFATQISGASDLEVSDISLSKTAITGKLSGGGGDTQLYIASKQGSNLAVAVLNKVKPGLYLPGLSATPFADLALPDSLLILTDTGVDRDALLALPKGLSDPLVEVLDGEGLTPGPGVTFLSRLNFAGNDPLSKLAVRLGVSKTETAILHGVMPSGVLKAITSKAGLSKNKSADLGGFALKAKFPPISVPGLNTILTLDKPSELSILSDASGALNMDLSSSGQFTVPIINKTSPVSTNLSLSGLGKNRKILIKALTGDEGTDTSKRIQLLATGPFDPSNLKSAKDFVVTFENGMTLADVMGADVPGIGGLRLANAKLALNHVSGTIALGDSELSVNLASFGGGGSKNRLLTLDAVELPGLSVIPGLSGSPLKDMKLQDMVISYLPPLPSGGGGSGLSLDQLPKELAHLKPKLSLPQGNGSGSLLPGLNLSSSVDLSKLGSLSEVLKNLGAGGGEGKRLKLSAKMPGEALAFLGERVSSLKLKKSNKKESTLKPKIQGLAKSALTKVIKLTNFEIPIPAIRLPGVGDYLSTENSVLKVAGFENPETKVVGLRTTIDSGMAFAVPGTPTHGTLNSQLVLTADANKNLSSKLTGTGLLQNVSGTVDFSATVGRGDTRTEFEIVVAGKNLNLGSLSGLNIPGVTELALNKAVIRSGELSGEIELRGAKTTFSAFDLAKNKTPVLALSSSSLNLGNILPSIEGSVLDAATVNLASFMFVPNGRDISAGNVTFPEIVNEIFDPTDMKDGLNLEIMVTPKQSGQLADLFRGIGISSEAPFEIVGNLPTNLFAMPSSEVLAAVNLKATLPKLSFNKVGPVGISFPESAVFNIVGSDKGLKTDIETALSLTLPAVGGSFDGQGRFSSIPGNSGERLLQFVGNATDPGGMPAHLEASMKLPGTPKDFLVKFAGRLTLNSLLNTDIPVIGDLGIKGLEKGEDYLVGTIALKGAETTIGAFRSGAKWAVAVSASGIKPSEFIPGVDDLPIKDLTLPSAMFVYVPKSNSDTEGLSLPFDIAALPKPVSLALSDVLKPFGGDGEKRPLLPGLNLKSMLSLSDMPKLAGVFEFTGSGSSKPMRLTGLLPVQSLASLTSKGSGYAKMGKDALRELVAQVDLETDLPAVNLPGVRDVVQFDDPHFVIKGDETDGQLKLAMQINGDMKLTLPKVDPLNLSGKLAIVAKGDGIGLDASGTGTAKGREVRVSGSVGLSKSDPRLQLTFRNDVTVADLIGADLPGLADLAITDVRFGSEVISGTVQYRGARTTLAAFDFKSDKRPFISLIPEEVDAANFIPGLGGSPLDNAKLTRGALIYVPDGKSSYPSNDLYSEALVAAIKLVSKEGTLDPSQGLKAAFDVALKDGSPVSQALQFAGIKQTTMKLRGSLPSLMVNRSGNGKSFDLPALPPRVKVNLPKRRGGGSSGFSGELLDAAIRGVDLEATVPAVNLPGINTVLEFGDPSFRIKGSDETNKAGEKTGNVKLRVGIDGDVVLKLPGHNLKFDGGFDIEKTRNSKAFKLALYSTTDVSWKKAFSLPFLDLNQIGLAGAIERKPDGSASLAAALNTKIKLSSQEFDSTGTIRIKTSGLPEVKFNINNQIEMANLPGLNNVPGINEVAFSNLWIGTGGLGGRVRIAKLGIGGESNLFLHNGKPVLLVRPDDLSLKDMLPKAGLSQMWDNLMGIKFPSALFALSTVDLDRVKLTSLPEEVQPMLSSLVGDPTSTVPISNGISLLASLNEEHMPPALTQAMDKTFNIFDPAANGGISGPLLLSGSLKGLFDGTLAARLAVKLPEIKIPKIGPTAQLSKMASFDSVGAEAVMEINVPQGIFLFGGAGNMSLNVPRIGEDKSDTLRMQGGVYVGFDVVSWAGSLKVFGNMTGGWKEPLGLLGSTTISDAAITMGVDSEGSIEFGVGGSGELTDLAASGSIAAEVAFLVNINFSTTIPLPKKLALVMNVKGDYDLYSIMESQELSVKRLFTGPLAREMVKVIPEKNSRDTLLKFGDLLKKNSIVTVMQLDKIPLPLMSIRNPTFYLATPGAKIPGYDHVLDTMGLRIGGDLSVKLLGKRHRLAGADVRLTIKDGLMVKGDIEDFSLEPIGGFKDVKMDVLANLNQLPHFRMSGDVKLIGTRHRLDMEASKDRVHFEFEQDLGRVMRAHFKAATDSGNLVGAREFEMTSTFKTEIDEIITKEVFPKLGIPKVVGDIIKSRTPLFVHNSTFKGKLVDFLKGNPVTMEVDHSFFGTRMKEPAVATVVPVWASANPVEVLPVPAMAAALTRSFYKYLQSNPISLGRVPLGLVTIEDATLSATSDSDRKLQISGRLNALGMPFSQTVATVSNTGRITLNSNSTIHLPLPLGPVGTLGRGDASVDFDFNPAGNHHHLELKVSTAALGFNDHIIFDLNGTMTSMKATVWSNNPCAKFRSETTLDAGALRNFVFKVGKGTAEPGDFIRLLEFVPQIQLPGPADAVKCGARVLAVAEKTIDFAKKGIEEIHKLNVNAIHAVGDVANKIIGGLKSLDCKLLRLGDCPRPSDCRGNERWSSTLKRCWVPSFQLAQHYSPAERNNKRCIDIKGAKDRAGQELIVYGCHGKWNQSWRILGDGRIQNNKGGCMGVDRYRHSEQVKLFSCNDRSRVLYTQYRETGQIVTRLHNRRYDQCLAISGRNLKLWHCGRAGAWRTDLWFFFDPFKNATINPGAERVKREMEAAFKTPLKNEAPVPLMSYRNPRNGERRYTTKADEFGSSFEYTGIAAYVYRNRAPGTVPLFRYARVTGPIHNYVFNTDIKGFGAGFHFDGVAGYVYPKQVDGSVPVYRYNERRNENYFFTTNINEIGPRDTNYWRYEGGAGFYSAKLQAPDLPSIERSNPVTIAGSQGAIAFPKRADGTVPLYKYRKRANGTLLFTRDIAEQGFGSPWFEYQGIAAYVYPDNKPGTRPIYRYYNSGNGEHRLTSDANRWNGEKGASGYRFEAVVGYTPGPDFGPGKHDKITNAKPVPFLRYFNAASNDHMYTADPNQLGDGRDGYVRDGIAGSIYPSRVKGTIPLYRYWNEARKDHVFTTRFDDFWYGKDGYDYVAVEGFVYPTEVKNSKALHRYFNGATKDTLLTTNFDEFNGRNGKNGFGYHRIEGWVPPIQAPGTEQAATNSRPEPLIRYRHTGNGDHRMVRGLADLGTGRDGYEFEKVVGMIFPEKASGTVPLYQYYNSRTKDYAVAKDFEDWGYGKSGYSYLGILGFVYPDPQSGSVELRRYVHKSTGEILETTDLDAFKKSDIAGSYSDERSLGAFLPAFVPPGADDAITKADPKLLVRYHNATSGDHAMYAGQEELDSGRDGYLLERYFGYIYPKRAEGTVPLYRYYNEDRKDTLITANFREYWYGKGGYEYQGVLGFVYTEPGSDRVAIHRYFNRNKLDSLITTEFDEFNGRSGKDGYDYSQIIGWVNPFVAPGLDTENEKSNPVPFVQYKHEKAGHFILTAGSSKFGIGDGDLRIQKAQGRIYPKRNAGLVPLYQYVHKYNKTKHYTTDFNEWLFSRGDLQFDQVVGYIHKENLQGTVALHRYSLASGNGGVLTVYPEQYAGLSGYTSDGVVGWVPAYVEQKKNGFSGAYLATNDNFSCLESGSVANSILSSRLCSEHADLKFSFWTDGTVRQDGKDLCLGVPHQNTDKSSVSAQICDYTTSQQWQVRWAGSEPAAADAKTALQLVHISSGKCLGLENASALDGIEGDLYTCEEPGRNAQTWVMSSAVPAYVIPGTDAPVTQSEPKFMVRYQAPATKAGDHLITIGFEELGRGNQNYTPQRLLGRLHETRASADMIPLYRYFNETTGDHLHTANFHERRFGLEYKFEGISGYVKPTEAAERVALYRYQNKSKGDHLITTDFAEWGSSAGRDGYTYLGAEGWALNTGAKPLTGFESIYLANEGNMVCLENLQDGRVSSARCEDRSEMKLSFYSDNTVRSFDGEYCLEADMATGSPIRFEACNDNLLQRWDIKWLAQVPSSAAGKQAFRLEHWRSQNCLSLTEGSGVDGVAAESGTCEPASSTDRQKVWWAHTDLPVFVAPGTDTPIAVSRPEPLIQYVNKGLPSGDHRLTAGPAKLGLGKDGYEMLLAQGKIYPTRAQDSLPLYRYRHEGNGDHLYTRFFRELGWGRLGYAYEGLEGYIFADQKAGTVALHRFVHPSRGDHLYTSKFEDAGGASGKDGYKYEGIAAWVLEYPETPEPELSETWLATNKNLSCLDGTISGDVSLASSFCHDHAEGTFTYWRDNTLRREGTNLCLSSRDAGTDGSLLTMERCDYTRDQQFALNWQGNAPRTDGTTPLRVVHMDSGKCVGLNDHSGQDGVTAHLLTCDGADESVQSWVMSSTQPKFVAPFTDTPEQSATSVPFIRYWNEADKDHLMQAGPGPFGLGQNGYEMQLAQSKIFAARAPGTVPLYRYRNTSELNTVYTRDFHEFRNFKGNTVFDGLVGYVYGKETPGTVALHRYRNENQKDHLLAGDLQEYGGQGGKDGFAYDGIVGWAPEYPEKPIQALERVYVSTNKNLSCLNAEARDGADLSSSFCHDHNTGQISFWQDNTIRHEEKNLCFSARAPQEGSAVTIERCDYTRDQQFKSAWVGRADGVADGKTALQISHLDSGLCVGLADTSGHDGVNATLQKCVNPGENAQTWVVDNSRPVFVAPFTDTPVEPSRPVPFIRYYSSSQKDHLMQAGPEPYGLGKEGYEMQTAQAYIYKTRAKDTLPLYRYRNAITKDTLYTSDFHEYRNFKGDISFDGHVGFVFSQSRAGLSPLYRYANTALGDHLISGKPEEYGGASGKDGYVQEGIVAWLPTYEEEPRQGLESLYVATNKNLSCLDASAVDGAPLSSSFCEGTGDLKFSAWKDGTFRHNSKNLCLSLRSTNGNDIPLTINRCDYTRDQLWTVSALKSGPVRADGAMDLKITHTDSDLCIGLADASGLDGVHAVAQKCGKVERNVQTWHFNVSTPQFVAPGMEVAEKTSEPVSLVRYQKKVGSRTDHVFKAGPGEWGYSSDKYVAEYPQGLIFKTRVAQSVPLYQYVNKRTKTHTYSADFHEYRYARDGYGFDGFVGYVYPTQTKDTVPLKRYSRTQSNEHALATDKQWSAGFTFERDVAWVMPYIETAQSPYSNVALVGKNNYCFAGTVTPNGNGKAELNACYDTPDQRFSLFNDDTLRHDESGLCLTSHERNKATLEECIYWQPDQRFRLSDIINTSNKKLPDIGEKLRLQHIASSACISLIGGHAKRGAGVNLTRCSGASNPDQNWVPVDVFPKAEKQRDWENLVYAGLEGMCLSRSSRQKRQGVIVDACETAGVSGYSLFDDKTFRQESSGDCLTVPEGGSDKTQLLFAPCAINNPQQQFEILWNGSGKAPKAPKYNRTFRIQHIATNLCARVQNGKWQERQKVVMRACVGSKGRAEQNWKMRQVIGN